MLKSGKRKKKKKTRALLMIIGRLTACLIQILVGFAPKKADKKIFIQSKFLPLNVIYCVLHREQKHPFF